MDIHGLVGWPLPCERQRVNRELAMDNEHLVEPSSVHKVSSPPPLPPRRKPSPIPPPPPHIIPANGELGDRSQADTSLLLSNLEDAEEDGLTERQLRELYDNEEIDRFLTLFSDVCNYLSYG